MSDYPKFSNAQIACLRDAGQVKGPNLILSLAFLDEIAPDRIRTSGVERLAKFGPVLESATADDKGVKVIPVQVLGAAGFPIASVANPTYWSGLGDGSQMAFDAGYKSRHRVGMVGENVQIDIVLSPLTDSDRTAHEKRVATAASKAAATKAANEAAKGTSEGPAVQNGVEGEATA